MKALKKLKPTVLLLTIISILSCNKGDHDIKQEHELVGVWQRSDFSEYFEYKLHFNSDKTGMRTSTKYYDDGKAISNAVSVNWSTIDNQLTLLIADEKYNILYSFNSEGQLILNSLTELPFNKLE